MNWNHPKIYSRSFVVISAVGLLSAAILILPAQGEVISKESLTAQVTPPPPPKPFPAVTTEAKAVVVWDVEKNEPLYFMNADNKMPLASITKLMTALVASEIFAPEDIIPISESALGGGSNAGLMAGDSWTAKNLIEYKLTTSSNGAGTALLEAAKNRGIDFVAKMNERAQTLGLTNTFYINETGLDIEGSYGGSYGSAIDTAKLLSYIVAEKPDLLVSTTRSYITRTSASGRSYTGENTNEIVGKIPGLIGSKTGFTLAAGGNLAVAFDAGLARPIVVVVLGSSKNGRFTDVLTLTKATIGYLAN